MEEVTADYHGHCFEGLQSNLQSLKGNVTVTQASTHPSWKRTPVGKRGL